MTMTFLLDVSSLLAWLWRDHEFHRRVMSWQTGKSIAICPVTELGFLRISTQPIFGATVKDARQMLSQWHRTAKPIHVPCDLPALEGAPPPVSGKTTDFYLASLAEKHGMKWATLDESCAHPAAYILTR